MSGIFQLDMDETLPLTRKRRRRRLITIDTAIPQPRNLRDTELSESNLSRGQAGDNGRDVHESIMVWLGKLHPEHPDFRCTASTVFEWHSFCPRDLTVPASEQQPGMQIL